MALLSHLVIISSSTSGTVVHATSFFLKGCCLGVCISGTHVAPSNLVPQELNTHTHIQIRHTPNKKPNNKINKFLASPPSFQHIIREEDRTTLLLFRKEIVVNAWAVMLSLAPGLREAMFLSSNLLPGPLCSVGPCSALSNVLPFFFIILHCLVWGGGWGIAFLWHKADLLSCFSTDHGNSGVILSFEGSPSRLTVHLTG